ncbi:MAG: hypothetical protein U0414_20290 [Polyangiaceae bacterium]
MRQRRPIHPRTLLLWSGVGAALLGFASCTDDHAVSGSSASGTGTGAGMSSGAAMSTGTFSGTGGGPTCIPGLTSIAVAPASGISEIKLDGKDPAALVPFKATAVVSGQSIDVAPTDLAWAVTRDDQTPPGNIAAGVLSPYPSAGGTVHVHATDGCGVIGSTDVHFTLEATVGTPNGDWGGPVATGDPSPLIVYPSDKTVFPRNIYRTLFQWQKAGFSQFRLSFDGPSAHVTVYTDGTHALCAGKTPAAGCWEVDEVDWSFIAGSNAGASATWRVDALDTSTNPPTVRSGAPISIGFSKQDVEGAIFYWSTTSAGVRRGRISQTNPEDYISGKPGTTYPDGDSVKCVACHVVSRDGKYLAAPVQSDDTNSVWVTEVTAQAPPTPLVKTIPNTGGHGFATISADDAHVVVAYKGKMWSVDRATGTFEEDLPTGALKGTHPDWSPKNDELVFATGDGDAPGGSSLARIPFTNGSWGAPTAFLAPPPMKSNLFPMFSPAGDWIAFAQGKGGHGDLTAQLQVIASNSGTPIDLFNANRITNNATTNGQYQNSQPTWAPPGDYDWIAFNSQRPYGVVLPKGTQQIWVAAVDLKKAEQGADPSFPAFRVPFQGLQENNHRAFWTLDVADGSGGGGGAGGAGSSSSSGGCMSILGEGQTCDPIADCCQTGLLCDTVDNGATYTCRNTVPS